MPADDKIFLQRLSETALYKDYEKAFSESTGLPLSLTHRETWGLPLHGKKGENPFCALMAKDRKACAACLEVNQKLSDAGDQDGPVTMGCFAGLCDTVVPIHLGDRKIGYLRTGQVMLNEPSQEKFDKVAKQLIDWGISIDLKDLREAWFNSKILSQEQYQSVVTLLKTFSSHLTLVGNQLQIQNENTESPFIRRAKEFIAHNQAENLTLDKVAKVVNTSTFYFCKMFKKATGLTFTEYLTRIRIEKAKNLLLNPHLRISEIAFEVGFQSLSQFNRAFRKVSGETPTKYRKANVLSSQEWEDREEDEED